MKCSALKLLSLILALGAASAAVNENRNVSRQPKAADILYKDPPSCSNGESTICIGCRTFKICNGVLPDSEAPTKSCQPDKPYCEIATGTCSATPDNSEAQCEDPNPKPPPVFKCTGVGMYPDPYSCAKFYTCLTEGANGQSSDCPTGQSFNAKTKACQKEDSGCKVIDCSATEYAYNEYPSSSQFFYYCKDESASVLMFACDDGARFDTCTEQCVFNCVREGLFAKSTDANKYYQCYKENGALKSVERSCALSSQVFDEMLEHCVYPGV